VSGNAVEGDRPATLARAAARSAAEMVRAALRLKVCSGAVSVDGLAAALFAGGAAGFAGFFLTAGFTIAGAIGLALGGAMSVVWIIEGSSLVCVGEWSAAAPHSSISQCNSNDAPITHSQRVSAGLACCAFRCGGSWVAIFMALV